MIPGKVFFNKKIHIKNRTSIKNVLNLVHKTSKPNKTFVNNDRFKLFKILMVHKIKTKKKGVLIELIEIAFISNITLKIKDHCIKLSTSNTIKPSNTVRSIFRF